MRISTQRLLMEAPSHFWMRAGIAIYQTQMMLRLYVLVIAIPKSGFVRKDFVFSTLVFPNVMRIAAHLIKECRARKQMNVDGDMHVLQMEINQRANRFCCPHAPRCANPNEHCGGSGRLVDGSETEYGQCVAPQDCRILGTNECGEREACYIVDAEGKTDCRRVGSQEVGESCNKLNDCLPGLACTGLFERTCARICELGNDSSCPSSEGTCIEYAQSPENTGLCTPTSETR